jgi:hypothetical protein
MIQSVFLSYLSILSGLSHGLVVRESAHFHQARVDYPRASTISTLFAYFLFPVFPF